MRIAILVAVVLAAGCGSGTGGGGPLVDRGPAATPRYDGPLDAGAAVGALEPRSTITCARPAWA